MINFTLDIQPPTTTAQQKGEQVKFDGRGRPFVKHFVKKKVADAAMSIGVALASHRIPAPMTGPILLSITFVYPWRKSESRKNRQKKIMPKFTKPDCSNIIKQIEDVMTKQRFWHDDSQIADLHVRKYWGNHPGITIMAYELDEEDSDD